MTKENVKQHVVPQSYLRRFAKKNKGDTSTSENDPNRDGMTLSGSLQNSGLVTGLALLSGGCPTCGTALLAPIITTVFSGSGFALAGAISGGLTILAKGK